MKSVDVEFLKDYVFSVCGVPKICTKGSCESLDEKTAKILVRNKACKIKKSTKAKVKK